MAASFGVSSAAVAIADNAVKSSAFPFQSLPVIRSEAKLISGRVNRTRKGGNVMTNAVAAPAEKAASSSSKPG